MTRTRLAKGSTSSKSSAFARPGVSTRSRSLFLRHRQQKCRKTRNKMLHRERLFIRKINFFLHFLLRIRGWDMLI